MFNPRLVDVTYTMRSEMMQRRGEQIKRDFAADRQPMSWKGMVFLLSLFVGALLVWITFLR